MWDSINSLDLVSEKFIPNNICTISFNNQFSFQIPLIYACFFSNSISQQILNDVTQREFSFNLGDNKINEDLINKIRDFMISGKNNFETFDEKIFLLRIASKFGCKLLQNKIINEIIIPEDLNFEERVKYIIIIYESSHEINDENLSFISSHFSNIIEENSKFYTIFNDIKYIELLELILQNKNLKIKNEDLLLKYILSLCKINKEFEMFIQYIYLEYCSVSAVNNLIDYVTTNMCYSKGIESTFSCFKRRLILEKLPDSDQLENERYLEPIKKEQPKPPVISCSYSNDMFDGIFNKIRKMNSGQNPIDCGAVSYTIHASAGSTIDKSTPKLFNSDGATEWYLLEEENNFISFDFKDLKISINGYSWESTHTYSDWEYKNSFLWEGSNDNSTWELIDSRDHNTDMGGSIGKHFWSCNRSPFYRYIRFRLRDVERKGNWLYCSKLELFGEIQTQK